MAFQLKKIEYDDDLMRKLKMKFHFDNEKQQQVLSAGLTFSFTASRFFPTLLGLLVSLARCISS